MNQKFKIEEFEIKEFEQKFIDYALSLGKLEKDLTSDDLLNFIYLRLNLHNESNL
jgi:hypothetical protein